MELKGSKTEQNLRTAFAGESQAHTKYLYYASKAKKDGYVQISDIFEETAKNEKEHAKIWFTWAFSRALSSSAFLSIFLPMTAPAPAPTAVPMAAPMAAPLPSLPMIAPSPAPIAAPAPDPMRVPLPVLDMLLQPEKTIITHMKLKITFFMI